MHQQGSIVRWDGARGFGFIRSSSTQAEVFFHVRDFRGAPEPALRMAVKYEEIHVGGKGPRAMAVRPRGTPSFAPFTPSSTAPRAEPRQRRAARPAPANAPAPATGRALWLVLLAGWLALLGWGLWSEKLPLWTAGALLALNLLTVWTYAADKRAARTRAWRVSENQLHLVALLGGWPAAWLAQQHLRHKTSKASFRAVYWLTVLGHCAALALWLWRGPAMLLS